MSRPKNETHYTSDYLPDTTAEDSYSHLWEEQEKAPTDLSRQLIREFLDANLTKKQKCYIMLYYRDGLTVEQIAEKFGVNKSTVSRTVHRGRLRLIKGVQREAFRRLLADKKGND